MIIGRLPPSRAGRKQIIAYILEGQAEAAYAMAQKTERTNQEIIALAINAVYSKYNAEPGNKNQQPQDLIKIQHERVFRRTKGKAKVKTEKSANSRRGRIAFAAWFEKDIVNEFNQFAQKEGRSVLDIIEEGLYLITGVRPQTAADVLREMTYSSEKKAA
jgi:hypothetical protein